MGQKEHAKGLIEQLRKYSEQAFNNHDNYIAEDLRDAADLIETLMAERENMEPVVRGEWQNARGGYGTCSRCKRFARLSLRCPRCGAHLRRLKEQKGE